MEFKTEKHFFKLVVLMLVCCLGSGLVMASSSDPEETVVFYTDFSEFESPSDLLNVFFTDSKPNLVIVEDPSYTGGKGVTTGVGKDGRINYSFQPITEGVVEFRFYDNLASTYGMGYVWDSNSVAVLYVGTMQGQVERYVFRSHVHGWTTTSIQRTEGWHVLKFVISGGKLTAYLDDEEVVSMEGFENIGRVSVGSAWPAGSQIVFDTIKIISTGEQVSVEQSVSYDETAGGVPPVDFSTISLDDFTDDELFLARDYELSQGMDEELPFYLYWFHRLANSVIMEGANKGFIDLVVWRNFQDNQPYNARVMENCLTLAYFYTLDRPWNPYYGSEEVREKLEAALDFWVNMQGPDGRFSEYSPGGWALAPTAFATRFMGEAIRRLYDGPPIDEELFNRVVQAQRKAIMVVLTDESMWTAGMLASNQYENVWVGALAYLQLFPDVEMEALLKKRLAQSETDFQSPAGFYYEHATVDWGYNFGTHRGIVRMAWFYAKDTPYEEHFLRTESLWYEWLSYNAVREPDGSLYVLNRALESRTKRATVDYLPTELAEKLPLARAFVMSQSEAAEDLTQRRAALQETWLQMPPLRIGNNYAYSPYSVSFQHLIPWHPTDEEKAEAIGELPYIKHDRFTHQRSDAKAQLVLTYIRRPAYYAILNAGIAKGPQRLGLGLLWHPVMGSLMQTQSSSADETWGTKGRGQTYVYEAMDFYCEFDIEGTEIQPRIGNHDLPDGDLKVSYDLYLSGEKTLLFTDNNIEVNIRHRGEFVEILPLLVKPDDKFVIGDGEVLLTRNNMTMRITFSEGIDVLSNSTGILVGPYEIVVVRLSTADSLIYNIGFEPEA